MKWPFLSIPFLFLFGAAATVAESSRPGGLPANVEPGELKVLSIGGGEPDKPLQLPLQHTDVNIRISGFVARATVTQRYGNPFDVPIEAVYRFPLPDEAAVDGMRLNIGEKRIHGIIKQRDDARRTYEQAKAAGKRAGLLEQERPNIFTQSVGNILPGEQIQVEISYVDILDFRDEGAFELVFPMVVGPRYLPGAGQAPDATRINPPVLKPGQRSGHDISLSVELDAAVPVRALHSVSHAVDIEEISDSRRRIRLHSSDTLPNKDFILRYQVAGDMPQSALITHHSEDKGGYFTLITLPQQQVSDDQTLPRDLIFILDTSGSMRGFPLDKAKQAMSRLIDGMRPNDRFNIVRFAGDAGALWPEPRANNLPNRLAAKQFVGSQSGAGGTEMRKGIVEALAQPSDPERLRIAFLLTDGYVGNEAGILKSIEKERRGARVFSLGVGSSINRYLLDRVAEVGLGEAFYVRQDEHADGVIERFFKRVDRPSLAHVEVDWNGLDVSDLTPKRIPDLWQGQPIRIHGRYAKGGQARISIRGRLGDQPYEKQIDVVMPKDQPENPLMATVWARSQVKHLMLSQTRGANQKDVEEQVTALGLEYDILTQWTSFVAVEEKVVNRDGQPTTVVQPVELPEGVDYDGVFGADAAENAVMYSASAAGPRSKMLMRSAVMPVPLAAPVAPTQDQAVAESEVKKEVASAPCRWDGLTVSGGLKYARVDALLRKLLTDLCADLGADVGAGRKTGTEMQLKLDIGPNGRVRKITLESAEHRLFERVRKRLSQLDFGPVAGGGSAWISVELKRP